MLLRTTTACLRSGVLLLLVATARGLDDSFASDSLLSSPQRFSLLRVVEKSLAGTAGVVKGVGDAFAVGTGGTIRMLGGTIQIVGGSLEGLGDAVAGETAAEEDEWGEAAKPMDLNGAVRSIASRPIRIMGRALRAVGDTTNFFGDTTERMTAEVIGILPDTVRVVESSVRAVRHNIVGDDDDADAEYEERDAGTWRADLESGPLASSQRPGGGSGPAAGRRGGGGGPGGGGGAAEADPVSPARTGSSSSSTCVGKYFASAPGSMLT